MPGDYYFKLTVDDGAEVIIDGKTIVSIDGVHPVRTEEGRIRLKTGRHDIRVPYLNNKAKVTMRESYGFRTFRCLNLRVPVQREMELGRSTVSKCSAPSGRGFLRHKGLPIRCVFGESAEGELPRFTSSR